MIQIKLIILKKTGKYNYSKVISTIQPSLV